MPTQLQLRRGSTSQNDAFTGAAGEVSVDTTLDNLRIHDGSQAGGFVVPGLGTTGQIGLVGNSVPAASTVSFGTPANAAIRVSATGVANVIVGDATITSGHNLDVRGSANVGAFTGTTGNFSSTLAATGIVTLSDATEASAIGTAAITTAGGIGVAKDMWIGDDIVMDSDLAAIKMGDAQAVTLTHVADTGVALNLGLGVAGNTAPIATAISMGQPANIVLRTNTHQGNVIIGDATATSSFTLDVRGTANTAILQGTELHQANVTAAAYGKLVPSGVVVPYGAATAPVGWLLCNDDTVSRTVYADLFSAISTAFGVGDGSTTFNLPAMGDRLPLGKGTNNGTIGAETAAAAASAVVATASGSAALTLTTGTFATSAKDSSQASALTNVTAGGHTHNLTLPVQIFQYIIKT